MLFVLDSILSKALTKKKKKFVSKYTEQTAPSEIPVPWILFLRVPECIHPGTCANYGVGCANKGTLL